MTLFARRFALLFFACALVAGPFRLMVFAAQGPEASIAMLQKAVSTHDLALTERYLDIDGVTAKAMDVLLADDAAIKALNSDALAVGLTLAVSGGANTVAVFKDFLQGEARVYVRHGVVSGAFAGNLVEGASTYGGLFKKAFRGKGKDKIVFGPAKEMKREGESALVATTLAQGVKNHAYPLELRLERQDGVWRVVELTNARELIQQAVSKDAK